VYKGTFKGLPVAVKLLNYHIEEVIAGHALKQIAEGSMVIPDGGFGSGREVTRKDVQKFKDECDRLNELNHDNIVRHIATLIDESSFPILVMELMDCSLKNYLYKEASNGKELPINYQFNLCIDICKGLTYLRERGFVHRDLCADNVLLTQDNPPKAKIADIGLSKLLCGDFSMALSVVTKREAYLAPEALSGHEEARYEYSLDIYAFGVISAQIIQVNCDMDTKEHLTKTLEKISDRHPMHEIVHLCLSKDRKSRPKASEVLDHLNSAHRQIQ
jgi:serine/threonine/tyrosine protein kinase RAD53